jgi:hypothetical protein
MRCLIALIAIAAAFCSTAAAQECAEEVSFLLGDGTITLHHREARFNCCAWIDVEVAQGAYDIDVIERERFEEGPCFCLCCFDVSTTIGGLDPGEYTVDVWKAFWVGGDIWTYELVGTWLIEVDGHSEPFLESSYLPCVETGAEEPDWSWGTIKGLYR